MTVTIQIPEDKLTDWGDEFPKAAAKLFRIASDASPEHHMANMTGIHGLIHRLNMWGKFDKAYQARFHNSCLLKRLANLYHDMTAQEVNIGR